ncbi:carboxypeptidase regulatory-like domain-containing protein [Streptomyces sp. NBC_01497]|uniref:carboxypeptidase regulatory-like domain-containing protein n=1 Tax=Streptomyces sp. NBC_01497 TaxID=2903885 RepID=UPI002E33C287|nr:carboxypeptidase regulatory-like domain-containing protein [Streptomyces sp. NBC_01497]
MRTPRPVPTGPGRLRRLLSGPLRAAENRPEHVQTEHVQTEHIRSGRSRAHRFLAATGALSLALVLLQIPAQAASAAPVASSSASAASGPSAERGTTQSLCGKPKPGFAACFAIRRTDVHSSLGLQPGTAGADEGPAGFSPADLRSAYALPADGGAGATIAIVDAYDDPTAESDLALYRAQFGLPACDTENGCFRKADERGGAAYPQADPDWAGEISLDLDMVSAIAPKAHILLVEADAPSNEDLGAAENTAVGLGAKYVSNSWGAYDDSAGNRAFDEAYFNHPGVAVVASSGDSGYGVSWPASSPYVTAVGGTSLARDSGTSRGWSESVWNSVNSVGIWGAPGSGCSVAEPKPAFQNDADCAGRSVADVSAVADPATGVAVYDSYTGGGWNVFGGTSAASPIIAGVYALAASPVATTYPQSYPYLTPSALNDVTKGDNASCANVGQCGYGTTPDCTPRYECAAGVGYDGPTGLGTPNGTAGFKPGPHATVDGTVTDSATGAPVAGATVALGGFQATTDAGGHWTIAAQVGSYPLSVSAFGYADADLGTLDLADGDTVTKDAALTAVPTRTISGTVRDGGGHGWGLYAEITLDGVPGTVFTDPKSGAYAVKVPADHTYTLHATALYPGYRTADATVAVTGASGEADFALPLDTTATLAPGYAITYHGGGLQSFDTSSAPGGWTVKNNTDAGGFAFDDPLNRGNQTGGGGRFAIVDDYALGWGPTDTELISPAYDFSKEKTPELDFDTSLPAALRLDDPTADVDVSTDGGATWKTVWHHTDVVSGPSHEVVPLTAYAGESDVTVRFHFSGSLTGYWEIDNVAIGTRALATVPGGLLVGQVGDANTGKGVTGATVRSTTAPADTGRSVASPGDPATGDGFYWAFSSATGKRAFTADLAGFGYPAVSQKVNVKADTVTSADFALHPASLRVNESAVGADVAWGDSKTVSVTVENTGGSPAHLALGEQAVGTAGTPLAPVTAAPERHAATTLTPTTAPEPGRAANVPRAGGSAEPSGDGDGGSAWQPAADLPGAGYGGIAAVVNGVLYAGLGEQPGGQWSNSLYSYDASSASWTKLADATTRRLNPAYGVIRGKLYVTGGKDAAGQPIAGGEVYDPATGAWSQIADQPTAYGESGSAVVGDKLYVVGGCDVLNCGTTDVQVYDPATDSWSAGAPYPRPVSYSSCATTDGVLYCAGGADEPSGVQPTDTASGYALDAAAGKWKPIADAPADFWGAATTAADGQLLVAGGDQLSAQAITNQAFSYDPARDAWSVLPNLAAPVLGAAAAPGWYVIGGEDELLAPQSAVSRLPGYDQPHADVPWLSEKASSLTVGAGRSVTVKLTLDATGMGSADLGEHQARLVIDSDIPYGSVSEPVSLSVTAPAGWGLLTGTVSGKDAAGSVAPLPGAVVQIDTKNGDFTLGTDPDGRYQLWLPAKDNPLTVIAAADGYQPDTRKVKIIKNGTTGADFTLAKR